MNEENKVGKEDSSTGSLSFFFSSSTFWLLIKKRNSQPEGGELERRQLSKIPFIQGLIFWFFFFKNRKEEQRSDLERIVD